VRTYASHTSGPTLEHRHRLREGALAQLVQNPRQQILRRRLGSNDVPAAPIADPPIQVVTAAVHRDRVSRSYIADPLIVAKLPRATAATTTAGAPRPVSHTRLDDVARAARSALAASSANLGASCNWPRLHT
jgi:hypothetical protein